MHKQTLLSGMLVTVLALLILAGRHADADAPNVNAMPSPDLRGNGDIYNQIESDLPLSEVSGRRAKIAAGSNSNATVTIDLIPNGGAGNQRDDGVTSGTVSGQSTKIAVEVFAKGVTTPLQGMAIKFDFDASVLTFVKAENSAFALSLPESDNTGTNFAATTPVTLGSAGFLARAEFSTVVDVTNKEFTLGITSVTLAESITSQDVITTTDAIAFNANVPSSPAASSSDFDGDGMVGTADFLLFAYHFGSSLGDGTYQAKYDLDGNGVIGLSDVLIFVDNFGSQVSPSGGGGGSDGGGVTIPDANLRAVIADSLGKSRNAPITRAEMATLTRLDASNKGIRSLTGLEFATNLQILNLGRVRVNGELVNSNDISNLSPLSNLTSLTYLDLTSNSISSISVLSNLTNLTGLHLGDNSISSISVLSNLTNLTGLNLWGNSISSISPLSRLTNLTYLSLSDNSISSISSLSNLTNLTELHLRGNRNISDISVLSRLTNLKELWLSNNSISDISALSNLTNLEILYLWGNSISSISVLSRLTNLTELYIGSIGISDISSLSGLANLTILFLDRNSISDISALSRLTNLTELYLYNNSISDISSLVANTGLGSGDEVNLRSNPLSSTSINTHIPALQRRGVTVEFDSGSGSGGGGSGGSPDLIVESPSVSDNTLTTGQSFTLSATVRNEGTGSSAATTLRYYQSSNATISRSDTEVGTDSVNGLSASGTSAESISLNAPSSAGTYYYGACVNSVTGESDTNNNCSDAVAVTVSSGSSSGGGSGGACTAGLVVNPGGSCTYKDHTFSVSSSGQGSIAFFSAGTGIDVRGSTINGVRWNFYASRNSGSNSWTIHVAD